MARVDELQKKYPDYPRDLILKWEVQRNGLRDSEVLDKVSVHVRRSLYASRNTDVTLEDIAKKRPESMQAGLSMETPPAFFKSGFGSKVIRTTTSPYEVKEEGPDQYALYEGEERIDDVYFPRVPRWARNREREPRTSKGTPVTSLVTGSGGCFSINPVLHCEHFDTGDQCKFCNFNYTHVDAARAGASIPVAVNLDETIEAYRIVASEVRRLLEGRVIMGGFKDSDKEAGTHLQFVEKMASSTPYLPNIGLSTQPMSRKMLQRLRDAGLRSINMNIEVWDPQMFEEVCPGKAKTRGRERYLECYQDAVDILGWGSVGTNMPPGVTVMPENGHKTWQEACDSQAEGIRWLIGHGVFPFFETLVLGVGSVYGENPANRAKLPPPDYHIDLSLAHHEACKDYGMYERMNRLLWCPLDCVSAGYAGQLGMVELAGDIGKWAATCVPEDLNWIGRFIESHKAPAKAE